MWWDTAAQGFDNYGNAAVKPGVEIACRWEDVAKEFKDSKGETRMSSALVYPDRVLKPGDYLMLGALADAEDANDPRNCKQAFIIARFDDLPDFKGKRHLLTAYL